MAGVPVSGVEPSSAARETRQSRDPLLGRVVGAYRIQEHVGEGTGLPSYLAEHVHLDRQVLFKLFHPPRGDGEAEAIRRAIQQARDLSALKHEGVLPLVEIATCGDGFMYVVLELSGARPLPALLAERGPLPWPVARTLGRQIAGALLAAEAASLAGAEAAASQVFVTLSPSGAGESRARVDLVTPEGLGWVAARPVDHAQAVGQLLYAMVSGRQPSGPAGQPLPELVLSFPELDIPSDADALIMRAVDPEPGRRWPDLAALYRELGGRDGDGKGPVQQARSNEAPTEATGADDEPGDATFGRRFFARPSRPALIAGAVGVAVAVIVALVIMSGPGEPDAPPAVVEKAQPTPVIPPQAAVAAPAAVLAQAPERVQSPDGALVSEGTGVVAAASDSPVTATGMPANAPAELPGRAAAAPAASGQVIPAAAPAVTDNGALPPAGPRAVGATSAPQRPGTPAAPRVALASPAKTTAGAGVSSPLASATGVPVPGAAPAAGPGAAAIAPVAVAVAAPASAQTAPVKEGAASPCTVSLGSIPWSDVRVDGQRAGFTPLTDFPVACGTHEVLFTSPGRGLERRITLNVRPGEKLKRIVDLGGPKGAPAASNATAAAPRPPCRLTLGSRPWAEVWVDGQRAGSTPLVDFPVTCGTHDVLLLSREANVQHRESLTVQSTLKRVITLVESTD